MGDMDGKSYNKKRNLQIHYNFDIIYDVYKGSTIDLVGAHFTLKETRT